MIVKLLERVSGTPQCWECERVLEIGERIFIDLDDCPKAYCMNCYEELKKNQAI